MSRAVELTSSTPSITAGLSLSVAVLYLALLCFLCLLSLVSKLKSQEITGKPLPLSFYIIHLHHRQP